MTNTIEIQIADKTFTFAVQFEYDHDFGTPWDNCDGHGPVSEWTSRDKLPSELVLNSNRGEKRYYDFAEACRIALRDGWDAAPYNDGSETKRQQAAKAARADFEYLSAWCNDDWHYVGVIVTLLDDEGNETEVTESLWGVETFNDNHEDEARRIAEDLTGGYGVSWDVVEKTSYGYTQNA